MTYEVRESVDRKGAVPFAKWLLGLKDKRGQAKIRARIVRASLGNFGDWKRISGVPVL